MLPSDFVNSKESFFLIKVILKAAYLKTGKTAIAQQLLNFALSMCHKRTE
jgi:hypothetical protein